MKVVKVKFQREAHYLSAQLTDSTTVLLIVWTF